MARILIFGGAGFIGSNLNEHLRDKNHTVGIFDNLTAIGSKELVAKTESVFQFDMVEKHSVESALREFKPEIIYHFAANSDIAASSLNPNLDLRNTFLTTQALIQSIDQIGAKPEVVFASSSAVYGEKTGLIPEGDVCNPISSYGWMKLASEELLNHAYSQGAISKLLIARFPNVTGKYQTHGVVHDLVKRALSKSGTLKVLGDGSQTKPFVLASELVEALQRIIEVMKVGTQSTINLSPTDRISVREIANLVRDAANPNSLVVFGTEPIGWAGDVNSYELSCARAEKNFGRLNFGTSEAAIRSAIDWSLSNA